MSISTNDPIPVSLDLQRFRKYFRFVIPHISLLGELTFQPTINYVKAGIFDYDGIA